MTPHTHIITEVVENLSTSDPLNPSNYHGNDGCHMPSIEKLSEIIDLCRKLLFPGYFGLSGLNGLTMRYHLGTTAERLYILLSNQIFSVLNLDKPEGGCDNEKELHEKAGEHASTFIKKLPELRRILATDGHCHLQWRPCRRKLRRSQSIVTLPYAP